MCFWQHPTYLAWEVPLFSINEPNFSIKIGFTWETDPGRRKVPGTYVESPAHEDDLVERFPGAVACPYIGDYSAPHDPLFSQNLTFPAAGPANFSGDGQRCTPRRREAPLGCPTACQVACISRQGRQGQCELIVTISRDKPSLYFLFIDSKRLSELNAP